MVQPACNPAVLSSSAADGAGDVTMAMADPASADSDAVVVRPHTRGSGGKRLTSDGGDGRLDRRGSGRDVGGGSGVAASGVVTPARPPARGRSVPPPSQVPDDSEREWRRARLARELQWGGEGK